MKKFYLLLFYLFFTICSISQERKNDLNYHIELYKKNNHPDSLAVSYTFFNNRKEKSLEIKYYIDVVYCLLHISVIEDKFGQYFDSEKSAVKGIKYLDSLPVNKTTKPYRKNLLNRLGNVMERYGEYEKSIKYYSEAIKYSPEIGNTAIAYNNIGNALIKLNQFEKASDTLEKALRIVKTIDDEEKYSLILSNLGYARVLLGKESGLKDMEEALIIRRKNKDPKLYESYKDFINFYSEKGMKSKEIFYSKEAYKIAYNIKSLPYEKEALTKLMELKLYEYGNEYFQATEKLIKFNNSLRKTFAEAKYSVSKEKENTRKEQLEKEREKTRRIQFEFESHRNLIIAGFILLTSTFLYFYLKSRHKKEKLKKQFETEQRISKKLHDEVANDVYSMMSRLQNDPATKKDLIDDLEEVYLKTRDISKANAALDVSKNFDELLKDLMASYKTQGVNIFTRNVSQVSWDRLSNLKKETLYRVIQELMTNMKKHSQANLVTLQFEEKQHKISIDYVDNGIGCELKHGNGLRNTENRMELAGGSITFESEANKGFRVKMTI
ncbi:MAG: tetratricopeptide repeat protein [Flavobacteriaceae bacterium]